LLEIITFLRTGAFVNGVVQTHESQQYNSTGTLLKDKAVYITVVLRGAENFRDSDVWIKSPKECCVFYEELL
jgi:hypothetical protein